MRKSFELHSRFGPSLKLWYQAISSLESDRVTWGFPESIGIADLLAATPRQDRSDIKLFDQLITTLPAAAI